ncbi:MAG: helix-turn-helix domain-containing protein [Clostridia bacterium]|nr:helix-turn-helix domain-containing protein [Clostridia bacterium]
METKDVILSLRTKQGLSQEELAQALYVTRQAVSRWENGETIPNAETLKLLSKFFQVSINTLLGSPQQLFCQCCGMPLEDENVSRETDGAFNEEYCKWCYADGKFTYPTLDALVDFLVDHFSSGAFPPDQARTYYRDHLKQLRHWQPA